MALFTFVLIFLLGFPFFHAPCLLPCLCFFLFLFSFFVQFRFCFCCCLQEKSSISAAAPNPNSVFNSSAWSSITSPFLSLSLSPHRLIIHLLHKETHTESERNICARFLLSSCTPAPFPPPPSSTSTISHSLCNSTSFCFCVYQNAMRSIYRVSPGSLLPFN